MSKKNKPIDLEYLKYLKEDSLLSRKDIQEIFGYKSRSGVNKLIERGEFPEHDLTNSQNGIRRCFWKKTTVMDAISELRN